MQTHSVCTSSGNLSLKNAMCFTHKPKSTEAQICEVHTKELLPHRKVHTAPEPLLPVYSCLQTRTWSSPQFWYRSWDSGYPGVGYSRPHPQSQLPEHLAQVFNHILRTWALLSAVVDGTLWTMEMHMDAPMYTYQSGMILVAWQDTLDKLSANLSRRQRKFSFSLYQIWCLNNGNSACTINLRPSIRIDASMTWAMSQGLPQKRTSHTIAHSKRYYTEQSPRWLTHIQKLKSLNNASLANSSMIHLVACKQQHFWAITRCTRSWELTQQSLLSDSWTIWMQPAADPSHPSLFCSHSPSIIYYTYRCWCWVDSELPQITWSISNQTTIQ